MVSNPKIGKTIIYFWFSYEGFPNIYCRNPVLGLGLGVDSTFTWDNKNNTNKNKLGQRQSQTPFSRAI